MRTQSLKNSFLTLIILTFSFSALAEEWSEHLKNIDRIDRGIYKLEQELDVLVERKKKTRDHARIEETLQRIVEIHAELIALRKDIDLEKRHIKDEHPEHADLVDNLDVGKKASTTKPKGLSPLDQQLTELLIKIQLKFASFMEPEIKKQEMKDVEAVVKVKERKKKEREADVYLRRKSKVKLVK